MPDAPTGEVFQPLEGAAPTPEGGNDTGKPSVGAGELAAKAAAEAVRGNAIKPGSRFEEMERVERTMESEHADRVDLPQEGEQQQEPQQQDTQRQNQQQPQQPQQTTQDDWTPSVTMEELEAAGIRMPVSPDEVDPQFRPVYDQVAQAALDSASRADEVVTQAREALAQVQDFSQRINTEEGQKRMLLTMAMSDADSFNEVMNQVQRMQDDPDYAESVRRQLEAEARYEAAVRKERVMEQQNMSRKAQQIEGRTVRLARQRGVDPEWAKQEVANQILRNEAQHGKRDITLDQVDEVVNQLADRMGPQHTQQQPRRKSPETVQREQTAPQTQTEGVGTTPSQQQSQQSQPRSDIPSNEHAMDKLRSAIRASSDRMKNKGL